LHAEQNIPDPATNDVGIKTCLIQAIQYFQAVGTEILAGNAMFSPADDLQGSCQGGLGVWIKRICNGNYRELVSSGLGGNSTLLAES
jgi:hypothetical protein